MIRIDIHSLGDEDFLRIGLGLVVVLDERGEALDGSLRGRQDRAVARSRDIDSCGVLDDLVGVAATLFRMVEEVEDLILVALDADEEGLGGVGVDLRLDGDVDGLMHGSLFLSLESRNRDQLLNLPSDTTCLIIR